MTIKSPIIFLLIMLIGSELIYAQNLVFNGSFEIRDSVYQGSYNKYYSCPYTQGEGVVYGYFNPQLPMAKGWDDPAGKYIYYYQGYQYGYSSSSDFYHSCGNDAANIPPAPYEYPGEVGVPKSRWLVGYQYPRTGEGFAGSVFYNNNTGYSPIDYGEYIQSKLKSKLKKDTLYKCIFYIVRDNLCGTSIQAQGAHLSNNKIKLSDLLNGIKDSTLTPQVINSNGYIDDTLNWTKIEGVFKANGDEEYITIGNFDVRKGLGHIIDPDFNNNHRDWAGYAIDDISVFPVSAPIDSARCGNDTLICLGNSLTLGKSHVKPEYKSEYSFEWYIQGEEDSVFSYEEHPVVSPETTTTYVVRVIDFKFDKSTDSVKVTVVDCNEPTNLIVYPNPSYGMVNFKFNSPIPENMSIEIYNIAGQLLKRSKFEQNYEIKELQLNLSAFAVGMYFYSVIINGERKFNGKLIKIK
jgi:hypothetical protein